MASRWAKNLSSRTLLLLFLIILNGERCAIAESFMCRGSRPEWLGLPRKDTVGTRAQGKVWRVFHGVRPLRNGVKRLRIRWTFSRKQIKDQQTGREARMRVLRNGHRNSARNKTLGIASDRGRRRGDESTVSVINALGSERRRKEALAAPSNAKKNFSSRVACVRGPKKCVIF